VEVDCASMQTLLRRSDGVLVQLGETSNGQGNVPTATPGVEFTQISAGRNHHAALRSDGQIVTWGSAPSVALPTLPQGVYYVEVRVGDLFTLARRSDGLLEVGVHGSSSSFPNGVNYIPPLASAESYVSIGTNKRDTCVARVGGASTYSAVGFGCGGSMPAARLVPQDTPRIGFPFTIRVFDLPVEAAVLAFGWQDSPGVSLGSIGMPGCVQYVTVQSWVFLHGNNHQAPYQMPIPNWTGLIGLSFFNQAIVFDPASGNALGAVVSDAARGTIGH
jgi:hypothetical protein